jgi:hypothetical protein
MWCCKEEKIDPWHGPPINIRVSPAHFSHPAECKTDLGAKDLEEFELLEMKI